MRLLFLVLILCGSARVSRGQDLNSNRQPPSSPAAVDQLVGNLNKASSLIGIDVRNPEDERLGEVQELMLDLGTGRVVYVVLSSGGVLGVGNKLLALPPAALRTGTDEQSLILNADKTSLEQASGFDEKNWPSVADATFEPGTAYVGARPGGEVREAAGAGQASEKPLPQPAETEKPPLGATMSFIKASELIGMPVHNSEDQKLGDIADVAVDLKTGQIRYAVLSTGGFLGLGEKLYAVPVGTLRLAGPQKTLVMDATKDTFKLAHSFDKSQWPIEADRALASRTLKMRESFGEAAGARREAEFNLPGSSVQGSGELTAVDQSDRGEELEVTKRLRRELVSDDQFSIGAKNITIVTKGGQVTLRGMVSSSEERQRVYQKAKELAGGREVRDQLTIKNE